MTPIPILINWILWSIVIVGASGVILTLIGFWMLHTRGRGGLKCLPTKN